MQRQQSEAEVLRIVGQIDETRRNLFEIDRDDAPDGRAFRDRGRQDIRIKRAKTRLRTAAYRKRLAERRIATPDQVAMAILKSLVTSSVEDLLQGDRNLLARTLMDLQARGFDVSATTKALRRLRNELMDPADREGEATESTGPAIVPSSWPKEAQPIF